MSALTAKSQSKELAGLLEKEFGWTETQYLDYVKTSLNGINAEEQGVFFHTARRVRLDPFARQICPVKRWNSQLKRETMSVQFTIDGFRSIAERTGTYAGSDSMWCGPDGVWKDVWLEKKPPSAAKVIVRRVVHGQIATFPGIALFDEYAAKTKEGNLTKFWKDMPALMIAKVAEALALRKAFPLDLSGCYSKDEMDQADNGIVSDRTLNAATLPISEPIDTEVEILNESKPEPVAEPVATIDTAMLDDMQSLIKATLADGNDPAKAKANVRNWAVGSGKKVMGTDLELAYKAAQAFCLDPTLDDVVVGTFRFLKVGDGFAVKYLG